MYTLEEISAHLEIRDALTRYCRGCDRRDADLLRSAYWDDATDVRAYDAPDATPAQFARRLVDGFGELPDYSQHLVTNVAIDLDIASGVARVESYLLAIHPVGPETSLTLRPADGQRHLRLIGGRALDRFERREGQWRIAHRVMLVDWTREDLPGGPLYEIAKAGLKSGGPGVDPSYAHFNGR